MTNTDRVMQAFPPDKQQQVTLANWRNTPYSRWAFHHVREIIPSADICNQPDSIWSLEEQLVNLGGLSIEFSDKTVMSLAGYISHAHIDAMIVLHRDRIVFEQYLNGMTRYQQHILMSVSKSVLGMVAGILHHQGKLSVDQPATTYVPELETTAYKNTSVRNLLDMRAGVDFNEDYLATDGAIIDYRKATGWNPLSDSEAPGDLRSFYQKLTDKKGEDGGPFSYVSPNTDLLAWVIERACKQPYAEVLSQYLWQPLGAESNAYITVDRLGAPRAAGGVCTTLRDLARIGRLLANDGVRENRQMLPKGWCADLVSLSDKDAWRQGDFAEKIPGRTMSYRDKWYICHPGPEDKAQWYMAIGIHGQNIYVDAKNELVMVKFASDPEPLNPNASANGITAARAIRDYLVNHF